MKQPAQTSPPHVPRLLVVACALALAVLVAHGLWHVGGPLAEHAIDDGDYVALEAIGAAACLYRAYRYRYQRLAWACIGLGIVSWAVGDAIWGLTTTRHVGEAHHPLSSELGYALFYPLCLTGLALLAADGRNRLARQMWADGVIAGLTVGALSVAFAYEPILRAARSGGSQLTGLHLAYPVADIVVVGFVLTAFAMLSWRPGRGWLLLGIGASLIAIADTIYLYKAAHGTFDDDGFVSTWWPLALVLCGWAAWQPWRGARPTHEYGVQAFAIPTAFAAVAVALLCYGQFADVPAAAALLAAAALAVATVRAGWTFRENVELLRATRREAMTDGLTGLPNRRGLMRDLERAVVAARRGIPSTVVFFDLDGFKRYNDTFGHAAGDLLLERLADQLGAAVAGRGRAYRLGGDEFCALLDGRLAAEDPLPAACVAALTEHGEGFEVGASHGRVTIPDEADTATHALQLADQRMYADKTDSREQSRRQTSDVLMQVLREREPDLHLHSDGVTALVLRVGRRLGLNAEQLDETARAAELHDIGKVAVPEAILHKPGPLDDGEWQLMRQHTIIGDRILSASHAMRPVARIVRASHERWDGGGYPDGLAGAAIPLGARIVCVCDAYSAMTSTRPYQRPLSHADALAELRRCAGSQFDPAVVAAFCEVCAAGPSGPTAGGANPAVATP